MSIVFDFSFGSLGSGDGQLNVPEDVVVDASGSICVMDAWNNQIQKFDFAGNYLSKFGSTGTVNGQFGLITVTYYDAANVLVYYLLVLQCWQSYLLQLTLRSFAVANTHILFIHLYEVAT